MSNKIVSCAILGALVIGLAAGPASALGTMREEHQKRNACGSLVKATHSDLKGKAFAAEVAKCKADPEGYSKSSGM